jgi:hypothetical protein
MITAGKKNKLLGHNAQQPILCSGSSQILLTQTGCEAYTVLLLYRAALRAGQKLWERNLLDTLPRKRVQRSGSRHESQMFVSPL